jgi:hypothetical protein
VIRGRPLARLLEAQLVVDESWAFSRRRDGSFDRGVLIGAGLVLYACWVGTAAGAFGGEALGDPDSLGLDAAFAALFLASSSCRSIPPRGSQPRSRRDDRLRPRPFTARVSRSSPRRRAASSVGGALSSTWLVVTIVGAGTIACKAVGPFSSAAARSRLSWLGCGHAGAGPPRRARRHAGRRGRRKLVFDERLLGLAAAIVAIRLRAPLLVIVVAAAGVTALARLL